MVLVLEFFSIELIHGLLVSLVHASGVILVVMINVRETT
jgi:hypothetical protein